MKTAILYSGHARTFAQCAANHKWMLWRHFPDAHIFASLVDDDDAQRFRAVCLHYGVPEERLHVELVKQPDHIPLPEGCPPEDSYTRGRPFMHEPYAISVPPQAVLKQLWHLQRAWLFADTFNEEFDCYVRVRPDLWFHSFAMKPAIIYGALAFVPWWGRFGGVNDRFAVLGPLAARRYFATFHYVGKMIEQGCPLHPESLVAESLAGCHVRKLAVEFSTIRKGEPARAPEVLACDIAEGLS
jgi:hypothetical protein